MYTIPPYWLPFLIIIRPSPAVVAYLCPAKGNDGSLVIILVQQCDVVETVFGRGRYQGGWSRGVRRGGGLWVCAYIPIHSILDRWWEEKEDQRGRVWSIISQCFHIYIYTWTVGNVLLSSSARPKRKSVVSASFFTATSTRSILRTLRQQEERRNMYDDVCQDIGIHTFVVCTYICSYAHAHIPVFRIHIGQNSTSCGVHAVDTPHDQDHTASLHKRLCLQARPSVNNTLIALDRARSGLGKPLLPDNERV